MSLLPASTNANPTTPFFSPVTSARFPVIAGTTQTILIPGMTANGLVMLMYIHPGGAGQGQYFTNVVYSAGQVVVTLGQAGVVGEFIVYHVLKF